MTASRGGYLSVAASLIIFAILGLCVLGAAGKSLVLRFGIAGLAALIAVLIATAWLFHSSAVMGERAGTIIDPKNIRLHLWTAAIEQWKLQPLIGTGSGTYRYYGRQFRDLKMQSDPIDVHNDYLHLLCEYGAIAAVAFLLFLYAHLRHGLQSFMHFGPRRVARGASPLSNRLALNIGALCAVAAYIVHSTVDFNLHIPANALLLAFVFGLIANPDIKQTSETLHPHGNFLPRIAVALLGAVLLVQGARLFPGEYYAEHARAALRDENPSAAISFAQTALRYEKQNPGYFLLSRHALPARSPITASRVKTAHRFTVRQWQLSKGPARLPHLIERTLWILRPLMTKWATSPRLSECSRCCAGSRSSLHRCGEPLSGTPRILAASEAAQGLRSAYTSRSKKIMKIMVKKA